MSAIEKTNLENQLPDIVSYDSYGNCHLNLLNLKSIDQTFFETNLPDFIESMKNTDRHIVAVKISTIQVKIFTALLTAGFIFHDAQNQNANLTMCLKTHDSKSCNYPKFKTNSVGVAAMVFRKNGSEILVVQELEGPYKGWKPPTGTVEDNEDPVKGAIRELEEETGVIVEAEQALLTSVAYTPLLRNTPDICFGYLFQIKDENTTLIPQQSEIRKVTWTPVQKFLDETAKIDHFNPFVLKGFVAAAQQVIQNNTAWPPHELQWGSGKPVTLYSPPQDPNLLKNKEKYLLD